MSLQQVMPPRSISAAREQRAVVDEFRRDELALRAARCARSSQALQRHVVGDAAQQRHRRVRMRVDEAGDQHVLGQRDMRARGA